MEEWAETLKTEDSAAHENLQEEFALQRKQRAKNSDKTIFSIRAFKESYEAASGTRWETHKEPMWQGEWLEEAQKAKFGYLTREEAMKKWQEWENDDKLKKDNRGPKGFKRFHIPTKEIEIEYEDLSKRRRYNGIIIITVRYAL